MNQHIKKRKKHKIRRKNITSTFEISFTSKKEITLPKKKT
jgi:hypothetical protein